MLSTRLLWVGARMNSAQDLIDLDAMAKSAAKSNAAAYHAGWYAQTWKSQKVAEGIAARNRELAPALKSHREALMTKSQLPVFKAILAGNRLSREIADVVSLNKNQVISRVTSLRKRGFITTKMVPCPEGKLGLVRLCTVTQKGLDAMAETEAAT
jgi:DNA-binding MarR family transcriptional regulator